jgi:7,8-dihydropterin-6-yl-methyl-4-(beta-D-ribofuranosyl)aminobenzene 5'-phosphate synthase
MKIISVVFDNYIYNSELTATWGFSSLIQGFEKTILFDTGSNSDVLHSNIRNLGLNFTNIDSVFISHDHWDHTGGLKLILSQHPTTAVYMLPSFSDDLKNTVKEYGEHLVENNGLKMLFPHVYTTSTLGTTVKEQSLVIETENGLMIITGCAHPGIIQIIQHVKKHLNQKIYMVFGGFHLQDESDFELLKIILRLKELGVEKIGPCHCSGDRCRKLCAEEYKENFMKIGVGKIIKIE